MRTEIIYPSYTSKGEYSLRAESTPLYLYPAYRVSLLSRRVHQLLVPFRIYLASTSLYVETQGR